MNSHDVDVVLEKLSNRFNKIFYDREFVSCVIEDFQVLIDNRNKCCVLVFPLLGPNYLKAVHYQAKIFDLAVFILKSSTVRSLAVCLKKYLLENCSEDNNHTLMKYKMSEISTENFNTTSKRRRPERQLYIPPAQRKPRFAKPDSSIKQSHEELYKSTKIDSEAHKEIRPVLVRERKEENNIHKATTNEPYLNSINSLVQSAPIYNDGCFCDKCILSKKCCFSVFPKRKIFNISCAKDCLCILDLHHFLSKQQFNSSGNGIEQHYCEESINMCIDCHIKRSFPISTGCWDLKEDGKLLNASSVKKIHGLGYTKDCYVMEVIDLSAIDYGHYFLIDRNGEFYLFECFTDHNIWKCYLNIKQKNTEMSVEHDSESVVQCERFSEDIKISQSNHANGKEKIVNENSSEIAKELPKKNDDERNYQQPVCGELPRSVLVSDDSKNSCKVTRPENSDRCIQQNNIRNTINKDAKDGYISVREKHKVLTKQNEHEQEKELMRKIKENINRKTRPIVKYIDDNETLRIGRNDDVNNWEDLFNDDGQLQDDFFSEIVEKVGSNVTIVKAKEDYSSYTTKQMEELEHMVELYDFPSTLETHDIINAFNELDSESMYIKWVDETHALLVLGSLTQAQRALEITNPLIKVRPMSAASSIALAKANKFDLRPAMKRPQTNLQTARRLITTHLGKKSQISQEQTAKEREDLKTAKDMKKLAKKNEKDAWEGCLRSSVNIN